MPVTSDHLLLVQVRLENDSGIPRDAAINTFHFATSNPSVAPTTTELDEIVAKVKSAYDTAQTGSSNSLASLLGSALSGAWSMKIYDLHDAEPRVPIRDTGPLATFTPGSTSLPQEVALCLSYHGAFASGVNPRHRRGRVYFGPLSSSGLVTSTGLPSTSANSIIDTIAAVGSWLIQATASDCTWEIYSPSLNSHTGVVGGYVDNEWDTQRRRGYRSTVRQTI
jgi:hypothetical protein